MRTIVILAASSLLFAAAIVEIPSRLWPDSPLALLVVAVVALLAQGLLAARLFAAQPAPAPAPAPSERPEPEARQPARSGDSRRGNRRERTETPPPGPLPAAGGERETGSVKWFNRSKGFGFIIRDTGGEIFVHQRSIRSDGGNDGRRPSLRDGQAVTFVVVERDKGLQAEDVAPQP